MGQAPLSKGISLRTINRNFKGRSGTNDAGVYLVSPEIAALSAIKGYLSSEFDDDMYLADVPNTPFIKNENFFIDEYDQIMKFIWDQILNLFHEEINFQKKLVEKLF